MLQIISQNNFVKYDHDKFKAYYDKECKSSLFNKMFRGFFIGFGLFIPIVLILLLIFVKDAWNDGLNNGPNYGLKSYFKTPEILLFFASTMLFSLIALAQLSIKGDNLNNKFSLINPLIYFEDLKLDEVEYNDLIKKSSKPEATFNDLLLESSEKNNYLEYNVFGYIFLYMLFVVVITLVLTDELKIPNRLLILFPQMKKAIQESIQLDNKLNIPAFAKAHPLTFWIQIVLLVIPVILNTYINMNINYLNEDLLDFIDNGTINSDNPLVVTFPLLDLISIEVARMSQQKYTINELRYIVLWFQDKPTDKLKNIDNIKRKISRLMLETQSSSRAAMNDVVLQNIIITLMYTI